MLSLRPLLAFLRPYRGLALLAPFCMMLEVAGDLMQPRLMQTIIDEGIARGDMSVVLRSGIWMIALAILGVFTGAGCGAFAVIVAQNVGADLRGALFRRVQSLSFGNLDELETGGLITRLSSDVSQVQELVMALLRTMVRAPLLMLGGLTMAVITSPRLALLFVALIPFVTLVLVVVICRSYPLFGRVQARLDALNTVLQENLSGVRVVKAFARVPFERKRFGLANDALMTQNTLAVRLSATTMPLIMLALNGGLVAALWLGGVSIKSGSLQVGQLIAFNNYLSQTLMALMMVSMLITQIARAEASAKRVVETLETTPLIPDSSAKRNDLVAKKNEFSAEKNDSSAEKNDSFAQKNGSFAQKNGSSVEVSGILRFENVSFSYEGSAGDAVLQDISFVAKPGETLAILGATGAGKSSLVNLIPRFYDVTAGRITFDGVDIRQLSEATLRRSIGIALQEATLFSGTIRDNVRYGRPNASEAEVLAAARDAQADEFISRLPGGYDSVVGQRGVNLSGGQKQRIAIARALLLRPAILILDDSTSAVDVATEARIQAALNTQNDSNREENSEPHAPRNHEKNLHNDAQNGARNGLQTRIIVAQRVSAAQGADRILVLDDGHLVAQGTHNELLQSSSVYREIYESQVENGVLQHGE